MLPYFESRNCIFKTIEIAQSFSITDFKLRLFYKQLAKMGLLEYSEIGCGCVILDPNLSLFDFAEKGGFAIQDEILRKNIEKLSLEIEKLKPEFADKVDIFANLSSIANTLIGALQFIG
jgi:hypothetical protein